MAFIQFRSNVKKTGGLLNKIRKRKKRDFGSDFMQLKLDENKTKKVRTYGGKKKLKLLRANKLNVFDPNTGKGELVKILSVKENSANPNYVRMNIITKGAVVETEKGLAKVVSRPGQEGSLNGILVEKK